MTGIGHFLKSSNPSHGLDIQSVTPYCHGLDVQSKSRIGHPNRDLVWMILKSVQSQSRIGCPIHDWDWMILKRVQSQSRIGRPIHDWPGWLSNLWHTYVMDWIPSNPWRSGQSSGHDISHIACLTATLANYSLLTNKYHCKKLPEPKGGARRRGRKLPCI